MREHTLIVQVAAPSEAREFDAASVAEGFKRGWAAADREAARHAVSLSAMVAEVVRSSNRNLLMEAADRRKASGRSLGEELREIVAEELINLGADLEHVIMNPGDPSVKSPSGGVSLIDELELRCGYCDAMIHWVGPFSIWVHSSTGESRCKGRLRNFAIPSVQVSEVYA